MINEAQCPFYASMNLPPGCNTLPILVPASERRRENLEDPPRRGSPQLIVDLLHGIMHMVVVTMSPRSRPCWWAQPETLLV